MEVTFGPDSVDEPNLQYKLQRHIKVFNTSSPPVNRGYNLVASSSKYGLVFVASPDGVLSVYYLKDLIDKDVEPQHMMIQLQEKPTHIATSCDHELLAVTGGQLLSIFKITEFPNMKCTPSLVIRCEVNPSTFVSGLQWNPCIADNIAIAFFDGTLFVAQISTSQVKKVPSKARCICWSPKGKQLVTGNNDGTLSQYKPDLTPAKTIPAPKLFEGAPVEAMAIYWISTFQFAVVYKNATDNSRPAVTIINTPKGGQPSCLNYEDICYSMGSNNPWYYYLQGLAQWNIIMAASSNSMEIATLGSADGASWFQWCQVDEARPELPLTDKKIENYPIGVCIDTCAIHQLPWGENSTLPYMPLLHLVSQNGLLTIFNIINKAGAQICTPPQQLTLPAAALTSNIPGEAPQPAVAPAPAAAPAPAPTPAALPKPQSMPVHAPQPLTHATAPPQYTPLNIPKPAQQLPTQEPVQVEQKPSLDIKPTPPRPVVADAYQAVKPPSTLQAQENAALKAEQERKNEIKVNEELKKMLIKEVNDFQKELYNFMVKTRQTQAKLQRDINSINANFSLNSMTAEQLKKECSLDELRGAIVQLKLELVRACAVVAEARTHAEAKDYHQWTQTDPLTAKRIASIKNLAYYVQNQLDQAQKALEYKWSEAMAKDPSLKRPTDRMIRPVLDDVYQPLVKQQEILSRQQAVLRTLRNALNECDDTPMFKSTSLLRNTPFKKDPLSKLTKNILNMSIEPKPKEPLLSSTKLDALRDMLLERKTVKIKPVTLEIRQHLATMRMNYEKSLKEKGMKEQELQKPPMTQASAAQKLERKVEVKSEPIKHAPISVPSFTPVGGVKPAAAPGYNNVARTLFNDEPIEPPKAASTPQVGTSQPKVQPAFGFTNQTVSTTTKSVLKDLLQSKQANIETKNDVNSFMGQPICSPSSFAPSTTPLSQAPAPSAVFTTKPVNDMFSKIQPFEGKVASPTENKSLFGLEIKPAFGSENKPAFGSETKSVFGSDTKQTLGSENKSLFGLDVKPSFCAETKSAFGSDNKPAFGSETKPVFGLAKPAFGLENKPLFGSESQPAFSTENKSLFDSGAKPVLFGADSKLFSSEAKSSFGSETTPVTAFGESKGGPSNTKSSETGEVEAIDTKNQTAKPKTDKPMTNLFGMKTSTTSNVPDVLKTAQDVKVDNKAALKLAEKEKSKENIPDKVEVKITQKTDKKETPLQATNKASVFNSQPVISSVSTTPSDESLKTTETKFEAAKVAEKSDTAPFDNVSVSKPATSDPTNTKETPQSTDSVATSKPMSVFSSASSAALETAASIFGSAVASQNKTSATKPTSQTGSIFSDGESPTASSVFGSAQGSIFGATATTVASTFGSSAETKPSVFSTPTPATPTSSTQSSPSAVFGSTETTQTGSIFSSTNTSVFATSTAASSNSIFGPSTTSVFGSQAITSASVFGATTTVAPVFGTATSSSPSSIFGSGSAATPSAFTATTTQSSVFGNANAQSIFASAATSKPSVFGGTGTSLFGSPNNQSPSSVFANAATSQASIFGSAAATTQASVFGSAGTTQTSVFGTATTQSSVFGTATPATQASIFGATPSTQSSVFGATTPTTQGSIFGAATATTQASIFGSAPATTAQSGSLFGGAEASLFASASISTTNASSPSSGGSIFGGSSPGAVFGGGSTNVFGGKATFGQNNTTAASIFGGGGATAFGQQKPANNFWSGGNANTEGGFGSSGFGQQATTQASSIFGSSGGSFSTPTPAGQAFGSPQQSAFGSPQQQGAASPGGFGGSPSFGSKPVFGQPSGFGSPPGGFGSSFGGFNKSPNSGFGAPAAFGSGATFGGGAAFGSTSPSKVFGGSPQPTGFGATQSNATFENLATQNTLTFGNLAQQSGQAPQPAPSFNTSPSFTGWRG